MHQFKLKPGNKFVFDEVDREELHLVYKNIT